MSRHAAPAPPSGCGPEVWSPGDFPSLTCTGTSLSLEDITKAACNTACATGGYAFCSYDNSTDYCYGSAPDEKGGCSGGHDDITSTTQRWTVCNPSALPLLPAHLEDCASARSLSMCTLIWSDFLSASPTTRSHFKITRVHLYCRASCHARLRRQEQPEGRVPVAGLLLHQP